MIACDIWWWCTQCKKNKNGQLIIYVIGLCDIYIEFMLLLMHYLNQELLIKNLKIICLWNYVLFTYEYEFYYFMNYIPHTITDDKQLYNYTEMNLLTIWRVDDDDDDENLLIQLYFIV